jgi:hypothetical protein
VLHATCLLRLLKPRKSKLSTHTVQARLNRLACLH